MISGNNTTEQSVMATPGQKHAFAAKSESETEEMPRILFDIGSSELYKYLGESVIIKL